MSKATQVTGVHDRGVDKPWAPGEFIRAVADAESTHENMDVRLKADIAQRSFADGLGFEIPEQNTSQLTYVNPDVSLLDYVTEIQLTNGNSADLPIVDDSVRDDGALEFTTTSEGATYTSDQIGFRAARGDLIKAGVSVFVSNESLDDAPALEKALFLAAIEGRRRRIEHGVSNGTGVGDELGILNSSALVTVAVGGSQTLSNTATYLTANAGDMMKQGWRLGRMSWLVQQELFADLITATTGGTAHPAFGPATEAAPNGTLFNRPFFLNEFAPPVGTVGDFVLADLSDYLLVTKGGLRTAASMHVRFLTDESVFRFSFRFNGQPKTSGQITPFSGALPRSPYVALAARS